MDIKNLLEITINEGASDLHLVVGKPPMLRITGQLKAIENAPVLTPKVNEAMLLSLLNEEQKSVLATNRDFDFSYAVARGRFRVNIYYQQGSLSASFRLIPKEIPTLQELNLPQSLSRFAKLHHGLVLVTGPTGQGKSTTLASLINIINFDRACHIVTIEDPIEYIYPNGKALISQREMHADTISWKRALRAVLREDPDVVLIGEMRDYETIAAALTIAETGHLVFATLHTNSAAQTVDRIVDVFPSHQQGQIRTQLAGSLEGIVSQRLVPSVDGRRLPAVELLIANAAVRNAIREGKSHLIDNIIMTSREIGMITLDASLVSLVKSGKVSAETAKIYSLHPDEFLRTMRENV